MTAVRQHDSSHTLPPLSHEAMRVFLPGLERVTTTVAALVRGRPDWTERLTLHPLALKELAVVQEFLEDHARTVYRQGLTVEQAEDDANFVGQHLHAFLNFELHRRKVFWVDGSLAWMLLQTHLDIEGAALRLPFPCFAVVLTDRSTLEIAEALLARDATCQIRGERLQILTVYITRAPDTEPDVLGMNINLSFDARSGKWPYIVCRDLYVRPHDHLDAILDSHFPEISPESLDPIFSAGELKQLLHLVVNAVLYATSVPEWSVAESPLRRLQRSARNRGEKKRRRTARRITDEKAGRSGEDVFFLPGKIPISQIRQLRELERSASGPALMTRFMVRGHWRRANPTWVDQNVRWIEPHWKGPDMATVVEREYKMKV